MKKSNYFYGPVPSRRLGFSLGVDIIPLKTCDFDCIYCQLGRSAKFRTKRGVWVDLKGLRKELKTILKNKPKIDFLTISGSGEPTLHKGLNKIIKVLKTETKNTYPVCVITNSSLLYRKEVRRELLLADLIVPSLDAGSAKTFRKINNPARNVNFSNVVKGLEALRKEFKGDIWLEVMLVKGVNDSIDEVKKIKKIIDQFKPDKVQLNFPIRPTDDKLKLPDKKTINKIISILSKNTKIISPFIKKINELNLTGDLESKILRLLQVRPESLENLSSSLGINISLAIKALTNLLEKRLIKKENNNEIIFYQKNDKRKN